MRKTIEEDIERFWSHIDKSGECWEWKNKLKGPYAQFVSGGKRYSAYRFAWTITNGPIPSGLVACHKCDNRNCVRPDHIFLGTQTENMLDKKSKGRVIVSRGSDNVNSKLNEQEIREIRFIYQNGTAISAIANKYNVSNSCIYFIIKHKTWKHVQ